jgi:hypothetical protein
MRKYLIVFLLMLPTIVLKAQDIDIPEKVVPDDKIKNYNEVDVLATFPGGMEAFAR